MRGMMTSAGPGFGAGAGADAAKANVPAQAPAANVISIRFIDILPWGRRMLASLPAARKHADASCIARGQYRKMRKLVHPGCKAGAWPPARRSRINDPGGSLRTRGSNKHASVSSSHPDD